MFVKNIPYPALLNNVTFNSNIIIFTSYHRITEAVIYLKY
jgi:hypothetical protein